VGAVPLNVLFEMVGGAGELRITVLSDEHLAKAEPPILFKLDGNSTVESMTHSSKAEPPISLTATGMFTEVRLEHLAKASSLMLVRAGGNVISVSD
jgi:hypothetical protein